MTLPPMRVMPVGVVRMQSRATQKGPGICMVLKATYFQRTFRKPHRVPLMPEGDDEMGNHLMTKWCTKASVCVVFENGLDLRFVDYMRNHSTLIWERALLIT